MAPVEKGSPKKGSPSTQEEDEVKTPAKAKAKAKADSQKKGRQSKDDSMLDVKNQNRILKFLEYTKDKKKKATDEEKKGAEQALAIYEGLADNAKRNSFLKEFDANDGKSGNLKWATKFVKSVVGESGAEVTVNENFVTRRVR